MYKGKSLNPSRFGYSTPPGKTSISLFRKPVLSFDRWLSLGVLPLVALGFLMVASTSMVISDRQFGTPFHYLFRQAVYLGVGFLIALTVLQIPLNFWRRIGGYLLL